MFTKALCPKAEIDQINNRGVMCNSCQSPEHDAIKQNYFSIKPTSLKRKDLNKAQAREL